MRFMPAVSIGSYDTRMISLRYAVDTGEDTLVQQQFGVEADINTIVRRFGISRTMPFGAASPGVFGDFTGIQDYEDAVARIDKSRAAFMKLPAEVRERFANDPGRLVEFASSVDEAGFRAVVFPEPPVPVPPVVPSPSGEA